MRMVYLRVVTKVRLSWALDGCATGQVAFTGADRSTKEDTKSGSYLPFVFTEWVESTFRF
jgi:hypothetical protein